jgi:hypothetical protein
MSMDNAVPGPASVPQRGSNPVARPSSGIDLDSDAAIDLLFLNVGEALATLCGNLDTLLFSAPWNEARSELLRGFNVHPRPLDIARRDPVLKELAQSGSVRQVLENRLVGISELTAVAHTPDLLAEVLKQSRKVVIDAAPPTPPPPELSEKPRSAAVADRRRPYPWVHVLAALAAGVVLALVGGWAFRSNPAVQPWPTPELVAASSPVYQWNFTTQRLANRSETDRQLVYSLQGFHFQPRVATTRTHGWLYQIDSRAAYMLKPMAKLPDGTLSCEYQDKFDQNAGHEFFLIILANADVPALNAGTEPAKWLSKDDLARLQELGAGGEEAAVRKLLLGALSRLGLGENDVDLAIQRLQHIP